MNQGNGRILGVPGPAMQQPMILASPFNDVQMVAMIAANLQGGTAERVKFAMELVVEAFGRSSDLMKMIQAKQKALADKALAEA